MNTPRPAGWPVLIPRIVTGDVEGLVKFMKRVFGAKGRYREDRPAEMLIGDSVVMISGLAGRRAMSAFLYLYVPDVDATYRRALKAGATSLEEPSEMPYGDRRAMIKDDWGNHWQIATYQRR
ncbi:MAG: VOC family protein [Chloroflexi bacterium]|nr:MAG: VOC family protein [Chloroflexota bacterium]